MDFLSFILRLGFETLFGQSRERFNSHDSSASAIHRSRAQYGATLRRASMHTPRASLGTVNQFDHLSVNEDGSVVVNLPAFSDSASMNSDSYKRK